MSAHSDPSTWNASSFSSHPVDALEPLEPILSEKQIWKAEFMDVLRGIDEFMCIRKPPRKWKAVQIALGLSTAFGQTETAIAVEYGVSRAAVSKDVVRVLMLTKLENNPAWGLKSVQNRKTYMRTNGRRGASKTF